MKIIQPVSIHRHIGRAGVARGWINQAHRRPLGQILRRNACPVLSAVTRQVNQSIVAAHPDLILFERRWRNRENRVVILDACIVFGDWPAAGWLFALVVARQVRADCFPRLALIRAFQHHLSAVVQRVRIEWRQGDWRRPLKAVLQIRGPAPHRVFRPGIDVALISILLVISRDQPIVGTGVHNVRIGRIRHHESAFATSYLVPIRSGQSHRHRCGWQSKSSSYPAARRTSR